MAALLLLGAGALGYGALIDRWAGTDGPLTERVARAFILGFGILGWLAFFPPLFHHLETPFLALLAAAGLPGLWALRRNGEPPPGREGWTVWAKGLVALIALIATGDLLEGLSPPADADSLAYHFATPKLLLKEGGLLFIPRAVDGAIPLLSQMTIMLAMALGGEQAATLWCTMSGWMAPLLVYGVARRHLNREWSLAAAAIMLSMPAILYGAGTGQVEARTAAFTLLAAITAQRSLGGRNLRQAAIAGLAAGFFMASKYTGLILAGSIGLVLLALPGRWLRCATFGIICLLAGGQWYWWNWVNTGDPVYPMLFGLLPATLGNPWTAAQADIMRSGFLTSENVVPHTLLWWLAYPFRVLVDSHPIFEAGRTGLGLFPLLAAPFALAGIWRRRAHLGRSPLLPLFAAAAIFYTVWFFAGTSQRIRHYLPIIPIIVIVTMVAAERGTRDRPSRPALAAGLAVALGLQLAAQSIVVQNHIRRLARHESRDEFLARNIPASQAVALINRTLEPMDKVATTERGTIYLFDTQVFYIHSEIEPRLPLRTVPDDPRPWWRRLRSLGITHILVTSSDPDALRDPGIALTALASQLLEDRCAVRLAKVTTPATLQSRTLMMSGGGTIDWHILALTPESCPYPDQRE